MQDSDLKKAEETKNTLDKFFQQFTPDIYTRIVLEELLKEIYNEKPVPLHDKN